MRLNQLTELFAQAGCKKLYAKPMAVNDNSKNQVYFGPGFEALNIFPNTGIVPINKGNTNIFKAKLHFGWLQQNGKVAEVPNAQLILYPQYPEVRFSGFLRGCAAAPSQLMAGRSTGRFLLLGVTSRQVIGFVVAADSPAAAALREASDNPTVGVFQDIPLPSVADAEASRAKLIAELHRIHDLGWIVSKQLGRNGEMKACNAPQCGGFTLEAELGIAKNSQTEPDFYGWEVKQHGVTNFDRIVSAKPITLMTPEPDGGFYKCKDVVEFIHKFGYADKNNVVDRLNFGGRHRVGTICESTGLTMQTRGYELATGKIIDATGCLALVSPTGEIAASWSFGKLFEHWSRKHAKAAYVPSMCQKGTVRQYCYGKKVRLAVATDALRLLGAIASGVIFYDPAIKLERASTVEPVHKKRSQFRVASRDIAALYEKVEVVEV